MWLSGIHHIHAAGKWPGMTGIRDFGVCLLSLP